MLSSLLALAVLSPALASEGILDCLTGPCVTVPGVGKLQGTNKKTQFSNRDYKSFFSIPFGEPTGGEHRFQPPRPKGQLNDGKDAFDAGYLNYITSWWDHVCPQPGVGGEAEFTNPMIMAALQDPELNATLRDGGLPGAVIGSEDCLHLAVHTPELPTNVHNPKLPVMVYIHGGSFMLGGYIGAGAGKLLERDMVLVTIQYRVGPLGFMCLPDDEAGGNMGLLDQTLALKWVHEHIASFGGDPDQVTIQGESAGSASVTYHMISPLSQPYFHQAIAQSGSALSSWAFDSQPEKHAKDIATYMQCPTDTTSGLIGCLKQEKTIEDIVLAHRDYYLVERADARMGFGGSVPCSQTHGTEKFIDKHPKDYLMDAISHPPPSPKRAMFGANKHEGSFVLGMIYKGYLLPNDVMNNEHFLRHEFSATLLEALGLNDDSGVIYELINYRFFNINDLGFWDRMIDGMINMVGTFFIKASTYEFMKFHDLGGAPSYFYSFEHYGEASLWNFLFPGGIPGDPIPRGVTHGDELIYLFSTGVFDLSPLDWEISRVMCNMWANFVIYGDPSDSRFPIRVPDETGQSTEEMPYWQVWKDHNMHYLKIDSKPELRSNYIGTWEDPDFGHSLQQEDL